MKSYKLWIGSIILAFTLQACNLKLVDAGSDPNAPGYELTVTANAALIETAMASGVQPPADAGQPAGVDQPPAAVDAPPPTEDPNNASLNTATPTVSSTNGTTVTVSIATNCRTGPGQAYPSIYGLPVGVVGKVVGNNPSVSNYWVIEIPNSGGGTCWLWGQYATVTGDTSGLKVFAVPATPTPTASPSPTPTVTQVVAPTAPTNANAVLLTCVTNNFVQSFTATFTWTDNSNNETGFNIYVNGNFVDGSSKDQLAGSVGPNTTSYTVSTTALSKQPPIIKVEAFNNAGSSTRVSAQPLSLATCP